jgi:hypothetical protein
MSKQRKRKPACGNPYRRGYGNGIVAAVAAVLDDLAEAGKLEWVEYSDDRGGLANARKGCMLRHEGLDALAIRWEIALGIERRGGDSPGYVATS